MKKSNRPPIPPKMEMIAAKGTFEQRCNWNRVAKEYQRTIKWALHKSKAGTLMDLSETMFARRQRVAVDYTDRIIERYKHIPGLEESHRDDTGDAWLYLNFQPSITYNMLDARSHILCAAAIWVLDQISTQQDWKQKLYPLLPQDFAQLAEVHAPDLWSPNYDLELILSVIYVLYSRNTDIAPTEIDDDSIELIWANDLIAKGAQHKNVPSRCAFETLISLIPQEAIQRACASFESLLWAWIDRYFACVAPMKAAVRETMEEANKLARQYNKLREELTEAADDAYRKITGLEPEGARKKPVINPLMADPNSVIKDMMPGSFVPSSPLVSSTLDLFHFEEDPVHRVLRLANQMSEIEDQHEDLCETYDEIEDDQKGFARDMALDGCIPQEACREDYGDDVAEHMVPLAISDPYEICFALLWLLENDSDLPWLYGPGCGLMQEVAQCLPWGIIEHDKKADALEEEDEQERTPEPSPQCGAALDWYERKYSKDGDGLSTVKRNLAQILYEETGCIMSHDMPNSDAMLRSLMDYGIEEKDAVVMLHLISVLSSAHGRAVSLHLIQGMMQDWEDDGPFEADDASNVEDADGDLSQRLRQLQEENARLRTSMHETEKASRELKKELSSIRDAASLEHRELADLRELVFNQQTEVSPEEPDEAVVDKAFPYEVQKDTIIFGGHDTWLKAIRPLLTGNIRFISRFLNFDANIIRNADVIWIQANAMPHKQYDRIIDAARMYSKPVRYFTRASATFGAKEVMRADQSFVKR